MKEYSVENENFSAKIVVGGEEGHVFLHLTAHQWSKESFKQMKAEFDKLVVKMAQENKPLLFATAEDEKATKFWKMFAPLEELRTFGSRGQYWIGAWYIEDIVDGT